MGGVLRDHDVLLTPALSTAAFPHDQRSTDERRMVVNGETRPYGEALRWLLLANVPWLPATVAPVGRTPEGLPAGIQIIGSYLEDRTTLAFAGHVERVLGGFAPPPGF